MKVIKARLRRQDIDEANALIAHWKAEHAKLSEAFLAEKERADRLLQELAERGALEQNRSDEAEKARRNVVRERDEANKKRDAILAEFDELKWRLHEAELTLAKAQGYVERVRETDERANGERPAQNEFQAQDPPPAPLRQSPVQHLFDYAKAASPRRWTSFGAR